MSRASESMKRLRRSRRDQGLCSRCGKVKSETYACEECMKKARKLNNSHGYTEEESSFIKFMVNPAQPKGSFGRALHKLMLTNLISPMMLSKEMCVSTRSIDRWLYEGSIPKKIRWGEFRIIFNCTIKQLGLE